MRSSILRPRLARIGVALVVGALGLGVLGCGSSSGGGDDDGGTSAETLCAKDARKETFTPGMEKVDQGLHIKILDGTPSVPVKGNNTWNLQIVDGSGAPVSDATIEVTPFMPVHNHGTSVKPTITANGEGRYTVDPLYLFMAGLWRITIDVTPPAAAKASVQFFFCIDG